MSLMQSPADFLKPAPLAWHNLSIRKLHQEYGSNAIRPTDVVAHFLSRIEQFNPRLKAFIELDREGAWCAATIADRRFQQGSPRPLEGIVVGISANIAVRGLEHSAGMDARRRMVAQSDAAIVAKLREAGAIIVGTLNMSEAGISAENANPYFGSCVNPHSPVHSPGGAAGGAASAVSAGLCQIAVAVDTLGSLRIPAAQCGIFGLKPTFGAAFDPDIAGVSDKFDMSGIMVRSVDDLDATMPSILDLHRDFAAQDARLIRLSDPGATPCDLAVVDAYAKSVLLPEVMTLPYSLSRIREAGRATAIRQLIVKLVELGAERCERLSAPLADIIEDNMCRSEFDQSEDARVIEAVARKLLVTLDRNGVLVLPTVPRTAGKLDHVPAESIFDFTSVASMAGLPALTLPAGQDTNGMPIGLQLIGPARSEALLLREARKIDDAIKGYAAPLAFA